MFFLIRYQTVVASTREINLARQFSSVSLVHRTETNIARQFFEVSRFIIAVQQNFRDPLTKRLLSEIALNSPPMANGNTARLFGDKLPPRRPIPP
jgi:hypothetical protein